MNQITISFMLLDNWNISQLPQSIEIFADFFLLENRDANLFFLINNLSVAEYVENS